MRRVSICTSQGGTRPRLRTLLLHVTTNLSNQDDTLAGVVLEEKLDEVKRRGTREGVSADTNADGLAEADVGRLGDCLVGEGA